MQSINFPEYDNHKKNHDHMVKKISEYAGRMNEASNTLLAMDIVNFVGKWLVKHIKIEDKKYADFYHSLQMSN